MAAYLGGGGPPCLVAVYLGGGHHAWWQCISAEPPCLVAVHLGGVTFLGGSVSMRSLCERISAIRRNRLSSVRCYFFTPFFVSLVPPNWTSECVNCVGHLTVCLLDYVAGLLLRDDSDNNLMATSTRTKIYVSSPWREAMCSKKRAHHNYAEYLYTVCGERRLASAKGVDIVQPW